MFLKKDFIKEISALRLATRPSTPMEKEKWSLEYDLFALGYRGKELTDEVVMLCETAGELQQPAEPYNVLIKKYENIKGGNMITEATATEEEICELQDFLNICNHKLVVALNNNQAITLPEYKNTPRVVYEYHHIDGKPTYCRKAVEAKIENLPLPMKGVNFVVSRETIRAMGAIGMRLLRKETRTGETLFDWLQSTGFTLKGKIRYLNAKNVSKKFPEFAEWLKNNFEEEQQKKYLKDLKRYLHRNDIWAPGPRIRDAKNNVEACRGLLSFDTIVDSLS